MKKEIKVKTLPMYLPVRNCVTYNDHVCRLIGIISNNNNYYYT